MSSLRLLSASRGCSAVRLLLLLASLHQVSGHRILQSDKVQGEQNEASLQTDGEASEASLLDEYIATVVAEKHSTKQVMDAGKRGHENVYMRILSWDGLKDGFKALTNPDCLSWDLLESDSACHRAMPIWNVAVLLVIGACCCCIGCCLF
mmetsp:Transcript_103103/g.204757  ORF Transcript_103103/g.204757 Transcript_103103/m.204757 type:complete len:150 (+) Transcript_103103:80-529(+)